MAPIKKGDPKAIYRALTKEFPVVRCELDFKTPYQLLVATVLSAQCTDKRVNEVTPNLFKKYPTPQKMAKAKQSDIEKLIKSAGFFRTKAKNIKALSIKLVDEFGAKVPDELDDLVTLPGVGRKTANVVLGHAFGKPGITVDTHFGRLSRRFKWTKQSDPVKVEFEIAKLFPPKDWTNLSTRLIWHGRRYCSARNPKCSICPIAKLCPSYEKK